MRTLRRIMGEDQRVLLVVFAVLIAVGAIGFLLNPAADEANNQPGSTYAEGPDGTLALYRWLGQAGYRPRRIERGPYTIPPDTDALLILEPERDFNEANRDTILDWLRGGGTLLLAEEGVQPSSLLQKLDVALDFGNRYSAVTVGQPLLTRPPVREVRADGNYILNLDDTPAYTVYLDSDSDTPGGNAPIMVGLQVGEGQVFVTTAPRLVSNLNLGRADNAALVLNLLADLPPDAVIAFDEYHHGYVGAGNIGEALLTTNWGWAVLYGGIVVGLYLVLSGRRFGRVVPLVPPGTRRSSAEQVAAVGGLFRRAGRRRWVVAQYRSTLRSELARISGLDPAAPTDALADEAARLRLVDRGELAGLLRELDRLLAGGDNALTDSQLLALSRWQEAVRAGLRGLADGLTLVEATWV